MESTRDDILNMNVDQIMALVRQLGARMLLDVNTIIWHRLVEKGMYQGSLNPSIPFENKYPREKILGMDSYTGVFLQLLPEILPVVKQAVVSKLKEIPVPRGLQFADLPPEIQVNILGRVSPTAREGVLVSHGMKELADAALVANIRSGDLVDPTIGTHERDMYFKLTPDGSGVYTPEPGLYRELGKLADKVRKNLQRDRVPEPAVTASDIEIRDYLHDLDIQPYLISGTFDIYQLEDLQSSVVYDFIPEEDFVKFVTLAWGNKYNPLKQKLAQEIKKSRDEDLSPTEISMISLDSSTEKPKFLGNWIRSYDVTSLTFILPENESDDPGLIFWEVLENLNREPSWQYVDTHWIPKSKTKSAYLDYPYHQLDEEIGVNVIPLNTNDLLESRIILPSLRDDVYLI